MRRLSVINKVTITAVVSIVYLILGSFIHIHPYTSKLSLFIFGSRVTFLLFFFYFIFYITLKYYNKINNFFTLLIALTAIMFIFNPELIFLEGIDFHLSIIGNPIVEEILKVGNIGTIHTAFSLWPLPFITSTIISDITLASALLSEYIIKIISLLVILIIFLLLGENLGRKTPYFFVFYPLIFLFGYKSYLITTLTFAMFFSIFIYLLIKYDLNSFNKKTISKISILLIIGMTLSHGFSTLSLVSLSFIYAIFYKEYRKIMMLGILAPLIYIIFNVFILKTGISVINFIININNRADIKVLVPQNSSIYSFSFRFFILFVMFVLLALVFNEIILKIRGKKYTELKKTILLLGSILSPALYVQYGIETLARLMLLASSVLVILLKRTINRLIIKKNIKHYSKNTNIISQSLLVVTGFLVITAVILSTYGQPFLYIQNDNIQNFIHISSFEIKNCIISSYGLYPEPKYNIYINNVAVKICEIRTYINGIFYFGKSFKLCEIDTGTVSAIIYMGLKNEKYNFINTILIK